MNELQIFDNNEFGKIKSIDESIKGTHFGVLYALEYGDNVKIGFTKQLYSRLRTLKREAEVYGQVAIGRVCASPFHTNYRENKNMLYSHFSQHRIESTDLFSLNFDRIAEEITSLVLSYKDETEQIENSASNFLSMMQNLLIGGSNL